MLQSLRWTDGDGIERQRLAVQEQERVEESSEELLDERKLTESEDPC